MALRAPEVVLWTSFDHKIDIWSFGCYLFEIFTGLPLFALPPFFLIAPGDDDHPDQTKNDHDLTPEDDHERNDDDHLLQMFSNLGLLPRAMFEKWPRRRRYFDANMDIVRTDVGPSRIPLGPIYIGATLEQRLKDSWPRGRAAGEREGLVRVLRWALEYDPIDRPSATELLTLDWFNRVYDDDL